MSENTLDRLDRDPGGARRYVAQLLVIGGASNAKIAKALSEKFNVAQPTTRSVSKWRNSDAKLQRLVAELEAVKREVSPDDDLDAALAKIPAPVDQAEATNTVLGLAIVSPAFARLLTTAGDAEVRAATKGAGQLSVADFEARCEALLADYEPPDEDDVDGGSFYA